MCGIAGVYNAHNAKLVKSMLSKISHRGPDGWGIQETHAGTIGHRRLAIIDVAGGHQPMHAENDWIAFNGEIYNYKQLHSKYLNDQPLKTNSDTEVILRLFKKMGPHCVELLDGMFAFAIHSGNELLLARDPLGIKPLYISEVNGRVYYASEIKALALVSDTIQEFPPGYWFHSRTGWQKYVDIAALPKQVKTVKDEDDAIKRIRKTLQMAVQKRLMSDVPLGVSLSGGLDSSIVTALAREGIPGLKSFAVGVEGSDDIRAARLAAKQLGVTHHEYIYSKDEIMHILPKVIYHLESFDPALVRSAIANYFLARLAAEHVKVILTGEGADELYAGYAYLNQFNDPNELQQELVEITTALHNTNLQRADRLSMAFGLEARVPFLDMQSVALSFSLPSASKLHNRETQEKALLRRAFAGDLPDEIVHRKKQKFSHGAGSSLILEEQANTSIKDADFKFEQKRLKDNWDFELKNKEALYYYRILHEFYKDEWIFPNMGTSRSL